MADHNEPSSAEASGSSKPFPSMPLTLSPPVKYSVRTFASPLITLVIGPEEAIVSVHKAILTQYDYFAKCLRGGRFKEGVNNHIKLPEDDPQDFMETMRYLYTGEVLHIIEHHNAPTEKEDLEDLISVYAIADKYCIAGMCREIENHIHWHNVINVVAWCHLHQLAAAGLRGSGLWKIIMDQMVRSLRITIPRLNLRGMLDDGLKSDPQIAMELLSLFADDIEARRNDQLPNGGWNSSGSDNDGWGTHGLVVDNWA